jgi:serine/threonine protein kinase
MAGVLAYLHAQSIIHDDVKPENIMWHDEERKSVLLDFGAAIHQPNDAPVAFSPSGTPPYTPPEFLQERKGPEGDVWALGITVLFARGFVKLPDGEWMLPHALEGRKEAREEMIEWLVEIDQWRQRLKDDETVLAMMLEEDPDVRIPSSRLVKELELPSKKLEM